MLIHYTLYTIHYTLYIIHNLVVTNTFFKHPDAHTATWLSHGGRYWATKDYILVNRPFWPSVRDTR